MSGVALALATRALRKSYGSVGGRADLAVLASDPRRKDAPARQRLSALALVRGGRVVPGRLPRESPLPRPKAHLTDLILGASSGWKL